MRCRRRAAWSARCRAALGRRRWQRGRVRARSRAGVRRALPLRAEHAGALAPRAGRRRCSSPSAFELAASGRWPAYFGARADVRDGLRRLRGGADLPGLDLPRAGSSCCSARSSPPTRRSLQMRIARWPAGAGRRLRSSRSSSCGAARRARARRPAARARAPATCAEAIAHRSAADRAGARDAGRSSTGSAASTRPARARYVLLCDPATTPARAAARQAAARPGARPGGDVEARRLRHRAPRRAAAGARLWRAHRLGH